MQIEGSGNIFLQFSYQYHVGPVEEIQWDPLISNSRIANTSQQPKKSFRITTKADTQSDSLIMELEVCIVYQPRDNKLDTITNMIIAEIDLPSGYISNVMNIAELSMQDFIERVDTDKPNKIILYFGYLQPKDEKCIDIQADKKDHIQNIQPSKIIVYDYYNSNRSEIVTYQLKQENKNQAI